MTKRIEKSRQEWSGGAWWRSRAPRRTSRSLARTTLALEPLEQRQLLNADPIAHAGGPYSIAQNAPLLLDAALSYDNDPGDTLSYAWDLDRDGQFDDATDFNPVVPGSTLISLGLGPGTHAISVRVTDSTGASSTATTSVSISDRLTLINDIHNETNVGIKRAHLTVVGDTLFFTSSHAVQEAELWRANLDGTDASLVKDLLPGPGIPYGLDAPHISELTNVGGTLYFSVTPYNPSLYTQLWKSDGTSSGTVIIKNCITQDYQLDLQLTNVGGTLYFRGFEWGTGYELWKSDGTSSGTVMVKEIAPGDTGWTGGGFTNVGGVLYFFGSVGKDEALWKSDGTSSGTVMVSDIRPGPGRSFTSLQRPMNVGGTLYFTANDGVNGSELWKSDGTSSSTVMVKDVGPGVIGIPRYFQNVEGTLFFRANDGVHGYELWKSDGTSSGTVMVRDIVPGSGTGFGFPLTQVGGVLYLTAFDSVHGLELWKSDGTSSGTVLVKDIWLGVTSSDPRYSANVGGALFFTAAAGVNGRELWMSDGTSDGTVAVSEVSPGKLSNPFGLLANGDRLYFVVENSGNSADSLYVYDKSANQRPDASAGGPYEILEGEALPLSGSGSDPDGVDDPLTYSWDINGDGIFGDATGDHPTLNWTQLKALGINDGNSSFNVRLRVSDEDGGVTISDPVLLTVVNAAPLASVSGPLNVSAGQSTSYLLSASDASPGDQAANFTYSIDWNGDNIVDQVVSGPSGTSVAHTFIQPGPVKVRVSAMDRDGADSGSVVLKVAVAGASTSANAQNPSLTDLVWGGTNGNDQVAFEQVDDTTIRVRETRLNGLVVNNVQIYENITGRVIALGAAGNDLLDATALSATKATLDGGADNNTLYGGQGGDILIGGSTGEKGGTQGSNVIIAGNGNNMIYGNGINGAEGSTGGNHLIVGGSGNDVIYGSYASLLKTDGTLSTRGKGGQNLIIGGGGSDQIYASQQADGAEGGNGSILISGKTTLSPSALTLVLSEWTSTRDYTTRIANISGTGTGPRNNGSNFLRAGVTVQDDLVRDMVFSDTNGNNNWLMYALVTDVPSRLKAAEVSTYLD